MNLRIITKNHAADSKIGSVLKIDFRADWTHESNPTALELTNESFRKSKRNTINDFSDSRVNQNLIFLISSYELCADSLSDKLIFKIVKMKLF